MEGLCRLPNSYMYEKEIVARVKKAIIADGRFEVGLPDPGHAKR
jgi:hypothetical protein